VESSITEVGFRQIKVLRINTRMNIGGPAIQVTTLMNYISKLEVNQLLLTGNCEHGESDYLEFNQIDLDRIKIRGLGRSLNPIGDLRAILRIRRIIREFKPDIVHTHTFKAGLLGRIAAISFKHRPYLVHTFHGHLLHGYLGRIKLEVLKLIERYLATKTDILISVGERVMNDLIRAGIGSPNKYRVITPGFPIANLNVSEGISPSFESRKFTCAWIGRFVEIKAPERVLEIARFFLQPELNVEFILAGDGPLKSQIQRQSRLETLPIKFLGWVGRTQEILKEVDLVILTSINEGTPLSVIEAHRMGIPVISTDVGSVREIVSNGKSGYVIDYEPSRFAELIKSFAVNPDKLGEFSREALRVAGDKFGPEKLALNYLQVYKSLTST